MKLINQVTQIVRDAITRLYSLELTVSLTNPPELSLGDFALACHPYANQLERSPQQIALELVDEITGDAFFSRVQANNGYVNFTVNSAELFGSVCWEITLAEKAWNKPTRPEKVMIEYLSPNTNKPLHLGHARNGCIGMATANLLEFAGYNVVRANLINDRGIHICKSMYAWQTWGEGSSPETAEMKGDHFVGKWYVRFNLEAEADPALNDVASNMLLQWENEEPEIRRIWELMNSWVYAGFEQTYRNYGWQFDVFYHESGTYQLGKDLVQVGLDKGLFQRERDGTVVAVLPPSREVVDRAGITKTVPYFGEDDIGYPQQATLLRKDGTSVYMTQDLGTAVMKYGQYDLDQSIYVVGDEQNAHFERLFYLLDQLGYPWAGQCHHLSYGMVHLTDGKMKSREGKSVDADNLLAEMQELALAEILQRNTELTADDPAAHDRAKKIALGAIKFYLLLQHPKQAMLYDRKKSISFEGKTGPYCQYSYARANSVIERANLGRNSINPDFALLGTDEERLLIRALIELRTKIEIAVETFDPSLVAIATYDLARLFNQFYQKCPILSAGSEALTGARIALTRTVMFGLKTGLNLLGIEVLDRM